MKTIKKLLLSLLFITSLVIVGADVCMPSTLRVVGGKKSYNDGKFAYMVSIRRIDDRSHHCGGAIITEDFVLTAAHCICGPAGVPETQLYIYAGSAYLYHDGKSYTIERSICLPEFNIDAFTGDIALIKINERFDFDNVLMRPIEIRTDEVPVDSLVMVAGWGYTDRYVGEDDIITYNCTNQLMHTFVNIIERNECYEYYETLQKYIKNSQICTHNPYETGICRGDSGGPLVYETKLIGIVSFTVPCEQMYPDVYTRVGAYIDWIQKNVPSLRDQSPKPSIQPSTEPLAIPKK